MAKFYMLTDADIERLRAFLDRDPEHGFKGGSSAALTEQEQQAHRQLHRFYHFQICRWIDEVTK